MAENTERTFTTEDLKSMAKIGGNIALRHLKSFKDAATRKVQETLNPNLRMATEIRGRYDAFRRAKFSHEDALRLTQESLENDAKVTFEFLNRTGGFKV